jgi:hypothetical protein
MFQVTERSNTSYAVVNRLFFYSLVADPNETIRRPHPARSDAFFVPLALPITPVLDRTLCRGRRTLPAHIMPPVPMATVVPPVRGQRHGRKCNASNNCRDKRKFAHLVCSCCVPGVLTPTGPAGFRQAAAANRHGLGLGDRRR